MQIIRPLPPTGSVSSTRIILLWPSTPSSAVEGQVVPFAEGSVHADDERVRFPSRLDRTDTRSIRCTLMVIIDYRIHGLSVGEPQWPTVGCLFFSARTDLDFRRTPRILLASHVASDVPRGPPSPRLASQPANL